MGFPVVGTLGILIAAKRKEIIPEITAVLEILKQHRFYVSDEVLKRALILAGETKE
jgi:predicted nucleic acid-binding protein